MEHLKKAAIAFFILAAALMLFLFLNSADFSFTGNFVSASEDANNSYSYTKAICDANNYCEDYEIACKNGELLKFIPTGYAAQFPSDWKDPRNPEDINRTC